MAKEVKEIVTTDEGCKCQCSSCEPKEDSIVWSKAKAMAAKLTVLDKIISGLENGANIEHCLTLSNIYRNLCY